MAFSSSTPSNYYFYDDFLNTWRWFNRKDLRQVKWNAQRVSNTREDGLLGYLALVIPLVIYDTIPGFAQFTQPADPGMFFPVAPVGIRATSIMPDNLATQKVMLDEAKRTFNECQAVEVAFRNQIINAIVPEFLQPLKIYITEMLNHNTPRFLPF